MNYENKTKQKRKKENKNLRIQLQAKNFKNIHWSDIIVFYVIYIRYR